MSLPWPNWTPDEWRRRVAGLAKKYGADRPMRLPPEDLSLGERYYVWVLADDEIGSDTGTPSCAVCNALADAGSFALRDAVMQLDQFLEAAGGPGDMDVERMGELAPFPTMDDIDGVGVTELTALGVMIPPAHPNCRCNLAIV